MTDAKPDNPGRGPSDPANDPGPADANPTFQGAGTDPAPAGVDAPAPPVPNTTTATGSTSAGDVPTEPGTVDQAAPARPPLTPGEPVSRTRPDPNNDDAEITDVGIVVGVHDVDTPDGPLQVARVWWLPSDGEHVFAADLRTA